MKQNNTIKHLRDKIKVAKKIIMDGMAENTMTNDKLEETMKDVYYQISLTRNSKTLEAIRVSIDRFVKSVERDLANNEKIEKELEKALSDKIVMTKKYENESVIANNDAIINPMDAMNGAVEEMKNEAAMATAEPVIKDVTIWKTHAKDKTTNDIHVYISKPGESKTHFVKDLRNNGLKVNFSKVKREHVYDYITENTDCEKWIWDSINTLEDVLNHKEGKLFDKEYMSEKDAAIEAIKNYISSEYIIQGDLLTAAKLILENGTKSYFISNDSSIDTYTKYTYKSRGFSPGCQPMKNLVSAKKMDGYKFEVLSYARELTAGEIDTYELIKLD
jgi:hypothetical protein